MDARKAEKLAQLQQMIDSVPSDGGAELLAGIAREQEEETQEGRTSHQRKERYDHTSGKDAYKRIVELCGYHEFCQMKLRERLRRDGFAEHAIDAGIDDAVRVGLIDDLRWGEMRASALMRKGTGMAGIARELKENGIEAFQVDGWPDAFIERYGDDFERALIILRKGQQKPKNARASAYGKLIRKGYSADIAAQVSAVWCAEGEPACMR